MAPGKLRKALRKFKNLRLVLICCSKSEWFWHLDEDSVHVMLKVGEAKWLNRNGNSRDEKEKTERLARNFYNFPSKMEKEYGMPEI